MRATYPLYNPRPIGLVENTLLPRKDKGSHYSFYRQPYDMMDGDVKVARIKGVPRRIVN